MENELEHLNWNIKHALSQLEGPLSEELNACLDVSPTSLNSSPLVYQKLLETVQVLDKLLVTLTPPNMTLMDGIFGRPPKPRNPVYSGMWLIEISIYQQQGPAVCDRICTGRSRPEATTLQHFGARSSLRVA